MNLQKTIINYLITKGWTVCKHPNGKPKYPALLRCPRAYTYHSVTSAVRIQLHREEKLTITEA